MSRSDPQGLGFDPVVLRTLLDAYQRMLAQLNGMRQESDNVAELLAIATVTDEVQGKLASCQRRLDRVETHRYSVARAMAAGAGASVARAMAAGVGPAASACGLPR